MSAESPEPRKWARVHTPSGEVVEILLPDAREVVVPATNTTVRRRARRRPRAKK